MDIGAAFPLNPGTKEPYPSLPWRVVAPGTYPAEGNHGIALFPSVLVLDFDPRNYPEGRDLLAELIARYPYLRSTRIVRTPRNGYHLYLSKPVEHHVRKQQKDYPGIDFLSVGHYVCGPGTHLEGEVSGDYTLVVDGQVLPCPLDFLNSLEAPAVAATSGAAEESLMQENQFAVRCQNAQPVVQGARGIESYKLAAEGKDLALPVSVVFAHMRDSWNVRNLPPLSDKELFTQCERAYKYGKNAFGAATPEAILVSQMGQPKHDDMDKRGDVSNVTSFVEHQQKLVMEEVHQKQVAFEKDMITPKNTFGNMVYYLRNHTAWKNRIQYNMFADRIEMKGGFDWRAEQKSKTNGLTNYDTAWMRSWFSSHLSMEVDPKKIESACFAAANSFHPVRDYLTSLKWDGVKRLETFLPNTVGCADNAYTRAAGVCMMVSAVKRIYEPGCKQDYVLVLEHKQGKGKSQWVEILGGDWHSTGELMPGDKDTYQNLRGKWIVELPEMDGTYSKADYRWLKKIITSSSDTYRPSYARTSETIPRESIFIATLNPNATGQYLTDDENRRYWPIKTGRIDLEMLRQNRDQYFAEAVELYYQHPDTSWVMSKEAAQIAAAEQEARREVDPWVEFLEGWVNADQQKGGFTSTEAVLALGLSSNVNVRQRARLYQVLKDLGLTYQKATHKWVRYDWSILL